MPEGANLCNKCQHILIDDSKAQFCSLAGKNDEAPNCLHYWTLRVPWEVHDILPSLPALRKSSLEGCDFCRSLRETILSRDQSRVEDHMGSFLAGRDICEVAIELEYHWTRPQYLGDSEGANRPIRFMSLTAVCEELIGGKGVGDKTPETIYFSFLIEAFQGERMAEWLSLPISTIHTDRFSSSAVSWARHHLDNCVDCHDHNGEAEYFLPTRLLDIKNEPVRLITMEHLSEGQEHEMIRSYSQQIRYAALSYCWGGGQQSLTTRDNIGDRKVAITTEQISPVLRDAIEVTRLLHIDYLWMDALCILQGDRHDWDHQSMQMGQIYQNAHVTITTPSSGSSQHGFRFSKTPRLFLPFISRANRKITGHLVIRFLYSERNKPRYPLGRSDIFHAETQESHWASRGWTFQESYMACRMLIFGRGDVFFQCPGSTIFMSGLDQKDNMTLSKSDADQSGWDDIVSEYSSRQGFSQVSDVLPALSGIANLFAQNRAYDKTEYLAGLWSDRLHLLLMWFIMDWRDIKPSDLHTLCEMFVQRPPSWSWIGRGRVEFRLPMLSEPDCKIHAWTRVKGDNPFGEVESGTIRITGRVAYSDLTLKRSNESHIRSMRYWTWTSKGGHPWRFRLDWNPLEDQIHHQELQMVLLGSRTIGGSGELEHFGVLLHESRNWETSKTFVRVGTFVSISSNNYAPNSAHQLFISYPIQTIEVI